MARLSNLHVVWLSILRGGIRLIIHVSNPPQLGTSHFCPELAAIGLALTHRPKPCWHDRADGVESGLRAGFDQGHAGVGETEMVTDLVDKHVADNAVQRLAVPVGAVWLIVSFILLSRAAFLAPMTGAW